MNAIAHSLQSLPFTQLRKNKRFYLWYDGTYAALCIAALAAMHFGHLKPLMATWDWKLLALMLPFATQAQILCTVFVHNCTHNGFPRRINRLVGELCGVVVLTRFASWEVIHQRHHRYSDDRVKDPHPVVASYWRFIFFTIVNVEHQLQSIYYELFGDTPENRRFEAMRARVSYATNLLLLFTWFRFLGPVAFAGVFVPASLLGFFHLIHFNWSTHNAASRTADYRPVNLNHGYYRIGNLLWFGIYMHANHHKKANLFNPASLTPSLPITPAGG